MPWTATVPTRNNQISLLLASLIISVVWKDAGQLKDQNSTSKMPPCPNELPCSLKREVKSDASFLSPSVCLKMFLHHRFFAHLDLFQPVP